MTLLPEGVVASILKLGGIMWKYKFFTSLENCRFDNWGPRSPVGNYLLEPHDLLQCSLDKTQNPQLGTEPTCCTSYNNIIIIFLSFEFIISAYSFLWLKSTSLSFLSKVGFTFALQVSSESSSFVPFYFWIVFHCMDVPQFIQSACRLGNYEWSYYKHSYAGFCVKISFQLTWDCWAIWQMLV